LTVALDLPHGPRKKRPTGPSAAPAIERDPRLPYQARLRGLPNRSRPAPPMAIPHMLEPPRPRPAPRRAASFARRGGLLAAAAGLLVPGGCAYVSPHLERSYVRLGPVVVSERFEADGQRADGPFPGAATTLGTLIEVKRQRSTALDCEFQVLGLEDGDLDGIGYRFFGGSRWHWNIDGRFRPNVGTGISWTDFHLEDFSEDFDPSGPGAYADVGLDWMITPVFGLGLRLRGMLRYEGADKEHGMKPGGELALQSLYRF
jgi:hypothetical protein